MLDITYLHPGLGDCRRIIPHSAVLLLVLIKLDHAALSLSAWLLPTHCVLRDHLLLGTTRSGALSTLHNRVRSRIAHDAGRLIVQVVVCDDRLPERNWFSLVLGLDHVFFH